MTICQLLPIPNKGVRVNDEITKDDINSKENTLNMIVDRLSSFYRQKNLLFDTKDVKCKKSPTETWSYTIKSDGNYYGFINVQYLGQKRISDYSVKPNFDFTAESYYIWFNIGRKEDENKEKIRKQERDEFLEYAKSRSRR